VRQEDAVMAPRVCPWWLGYGLLVPFRRLVENPVRMLGPWVREGMLVVEPGCGMGFFTLDLARLVGTSGRVVAVDVQARMLAGLRRRAVRAGLSNRIETRLAGATGLGLGDLAGQANLALAIHVVHEVPDAAAFFAELWAVLRPGAALLVIEPKGHVSAAAFEVSLQVASGAGFELVERALAGKPRSAVLRRPAA
jgi:ubiquinone/menaquinone biosynthesis C-methylase UbiE